MLDRQKIFDRAFRGLKSQGFRQSGNFKNSANICYYTDAEGRHCAVGWCLTPSMLGVISEERHLNNASVSELIFYSELGDMFEEEYGVMDRGDSDFLRTLQATHDMNRFPGDMETALRDFAVKHALTVPND